MATASLAAVGELRMADPPVPSVPAMPTALVPVKGQGRRRKRRRGAPKPSGGHVGNEPKLNDAKIVGIAASIAEGNTFEMAALLNGVSNRAATYWRAMARQLVEQGKAEGKPAEEVKSPWPKLPAAMLVRFLRAVERASAEDEQQRISRITGVAKGGAVLSERTEERVNEKTGLRTVLSEKRYTQPEWQADAWLLERRDPDRWGRKFRFENPGGAAAGDAAGKTLTLLEVLLQVWAQKPVDPRALPAGVIDGGRAVQVS